MEEFLLGLGIEVLGGLLQGWLDPLAEQWKRPEAKPFFDVRPH